MTKLFRRVKNALFVLPTYALLFVALLLTTVAFLFSLTDEKQDNQNSFDQLGLLIAHNIRSQLDKEVLLMQQLEGLVFHSNTSEDYFQQQINYIQNHGVATSFNYVGYVKYQQVQPNEETLPEPEPESDSATPVGQLPSTLGLAPQLVVTRFADLSEDKRFQQWDYNFSKNENLRLAIQRARDTGTMSLAISVDPLSRDSYYMAFSPVYENAITPQTVLERRRSIQGYMFGLIPITQMLREALDSNGSLLSLVDIRLFDINDNTSTLLYSSMTASEETPDPQFIYDTEINVGHRRLELKASSSPFYEENVLSQYPWIILLVGTASSFVVFLFARYVARIGDILQRNENQLRLVTDSLPVLVSYVSPERKYVFNNKAFYRWFPDLEEGDLTDRFLWDVWGQENYTAAKPYIDRALKGEHTHYEYHLKFRGTDRYVRVTLVPDIRKGDEVLGFISLISDITDIYRAHQRLREKKQTLETLNQIGLSLHGQKNLEQLLKQVTESSMELTRSECGAFFMSEDMLNSVVRPYVYSGSAPYWSQRFIERLKEKVIRPAIANKKTVYASDVDQENRDLFQTTNSPIKSLLAAPVTSSSGIVLGVMVFGTTKNQTFSPDKKSLIQGLATQAAVAIDNAKLYKALRESESRHRDLAEWNSFLAEVSRLLGESLDYRLTLKQLATYMVPKMGEWCVIHLQNRENQLQPVAIGNESARETEKLWNHHQHYFQKGCSPLGALRTFETGQSQFLPQMTEEHLKEFTHSSEQLSFVKSMNITSFISVPIRARGRIYGTLSLALTQEAKTKVYDKEDLFLAEEVARRISTAMENSTLYNEAQAISRVKDEFLTIISHELRTPLNVILGYSDMLSEDDFDKDTKESILAIRRNALDQARLIDDLLDVSSIIRGQFKIQPDPVNLKSVVNSAIETLALASQGKEITLSFRQEGEGACEVTGDPNRLQQVVWHLISNSIKFTPRGGAVQVEVKNTNDTCRVEVTDNGQGIDPEFLPHIFERFRQEESGMTRPHGGLGLGLAIVKHVVELHGGHVTAESAGRDKGAKFTVILPTATAQRFDHTEEGWEDLSLPPLDTLHQTSHLT